MIHIFNSNNEQNSINLQKVGLIKDVAEISVSNNPSKVDNLYIDGKKKYYSLLTLGENKSLVGKYMDILQGKYNNIHDIVNVKPEFLSDLSIAFPGIMPTGITLQGNKVYVVSQQNGEVISLDSNVPSSGIKISSELFSSPSLITTSGSNVIVVDKNNGVLSIDGNGNVSQILGLSDLRNINSVAEYQNNLYFLDSLDETIFRSIYINGGYSVPGSYINDPSLSSATSISVDGNIFVSSPIYSVVRYFAGSQTPFSIGNLGVLQNQLGPITEIFTADYLPDIYILDPQNYRIIELKKPGINDSNNLVYNFINQFMYEGSKQLFNDIIAFYTDGNFIYLINGTKVLKFQLLNN